jgi:hypothetical protein
MCQRERSGTNGHDHHDERARLVGRAGKTVEEDPPAGKTASIPRDTAGKVTTTSGRPARQGED